MLSEFKLNGSVEQQCYSSTDGEQQNGLAPEQWVELANEIAGDGNEAARSEDGDDGTEDGSEEERDLPDMMPLMSDELVEAHQLAVCMRTCIPLRGVPAPGSPGEGGI